MADFEYIAGLIALSKGDYDRAYGRFINSTRTNLEIGAQIELIQDLEGCARVFHAKNEPEKALRAIALADRQRAVRNLPRYPVDEGWHGDLITRLKDVLGDARFQELWAESEQASFDDWIRSVI